MKYKEFRLTTIIVGIISIVLIFLATTLLSCRAMITTIDISPFVIVFYLIGVGAFIVFVVMFIQLLNR